MVADRSRPTALGIPPLPPPTADPPWKQAWDTALYGAEGFFRRESPADHFRTSAHVSGRFAEAMVVLARNAGLDTVVDVGAGRGELLRGIHELDPGLTLLGVEVAARPRDLPAAIAWTSALPTEVDGLLVANEWLDNVPCHVVEVDPAGAPRMVHVDPATGRETLGHPTSHATVPVSVRQWLAHWWPLTGAPPGARAEVGSTRDAAWADVVRRVRRGVAVAIDYGHRQEQRPGEGSLRSYLAGREVAVVPDGSRDVTAAVAVDAVAAAVGATVLDQRGALHDLGVRASPPPVSLAEDDPQAYLRALSDASRTAALTGRDGLGGFTWLVSSSRGLTTGLSAPAGPAPFAQTD